MSDKKYIIAVSGGVDSVVLLDLLAKETSVGIEYVVAHFDHGVREDSAQDLEFVRQLAGNYNLQFCSDSLQDADNKSEDYLRQARYEFLFDLKDRLQAKAIITAHHQDDLLETMILNLLRGTSPRGLSPMQRAGVERPLLIRDKRWIQDYAKSYGLDWREDPSNQDTDYLRNYIRQRIMPKFSAKHKKDLLELNQKLTVDYAEIDAVASTLELQQPRLKRSDFIGLPHSVARELVSIWLRNLGAQDINQKLVDKVVIAVKTLAPGKKLDMDKDNWLVVGADELTLQAR